MTPTAHELTQLDGRKIAILDHTLVAVIAGKPGDGRKGCEVLLYGGFRLEVTESKKAVEDKFHVSVRT
jgi:hypothetical protein